MNRALLILLTALVTACTFELRPGQTTTPGAEIDTSGTTQPIMITARLFYPERVALPGESDLIVNVDAIGPHGRRTLTRFDSSLDGRQVPIPLRFSVEPDESGPILIELYAAIFAGEHLLRLAGPVLVNASGGEADLGRVRLMPPEQAGFGQAWRCGDQDILFGAVGNQPLLGLDGTVVPLEIAPAASGASYRGADDPDIGVHEKGGEIIVTRSGETLDDCRRVERLRPPLAGGGNEPGWRIEIDEQRIELNSDYGQTVTRAQLIHTGASGRTTRFRGVGDNGAILAAFSHSVCRDSATGMPHPYSVEVQFEDGTLSGCGGRPRQLLTANDWVVERLGTQTVPDSGEDEEALEITLEFDEQGRVSGRSACNRYTAGYELTGERLSIDLAAATRMACSEPRMMLEDRFLELLAGVEHFNIGQDGELILIGSQGRITAVAQGL